MWRGKGNKQPQRLDWVAVPSDQLVDWLPFTEMEQKGREIYPREDALNFGMLNLSWGWLRNVAI